MEAKWTGNQLGLRDLNKLREKSKLVPWNINERSDYFVLFSKSGFSKEIQDLSKDKANLVLVHQDILV